MVINVGKMAALLTGRQRNMSIQLRLRNQDVEWKSCIWLPTRRKLAIYDCYIRYRLTCKSPSIVHQTGTVRCTGLVHYARTAASKTPTPTNLMLRMIAEASRYIKNNVIPRELRVQTIEDFIQTQTRRLFNCVDEGPTSSLHNLVPQYERPLGGHQLPQDLILFPSKGYKAPPSSAKRQRSPTLMTRGGFVPLRDEAQVRAKGSCPHLQPEAFGENSTTMTNAEKMQSAWPRSLMCNVCSSCVQTDVPPINCSYFCASVVVVLQQP
ncbi:hypothetical protein EVAR_93633_1 [Eumeta japonica]|uniref:Uncharacterized protein n=1 Tax=Eumeta variegata TaxID=151549 RepID=A0A4C1TQK6_EUMVA|nr:hypothetical protein EVAR_93633_1 [Eumeta japonica]